MWVILLKGDKLGPYLCSIGKKRVENDILRRKYLKIDQTIQM